MGVEEMGVVVAVTVGIGLFLYLCRVRGLDSVRNETRTKNLELQQYLQLDKNHEHHANLSTTSVLHKMFS